MWPIHDSSLRPAQPCDAALPALAPRPPPRVCYLKLAHQVTPRAWPQAGGKGEDPGPRTLQLEERSRTWWEGGDGPRPAGRDRLSGAQLGFVSASPSPGNAHTGRATRQPPRRGGAETSQSRPPPRRAPSRWAASSCRGWVPKVPAGRRWKRLSCCRVCVSGSARWPGCLRMGLRAPKTWRNVWQCTVGFCVLASGSGEA